MADNSESNVTSTVSGEEDIAAKLRDKVRAQAEALLNKVDTSRASSVNGDDLGGGGSTAVSPSNNGLLNDTNDGTAVADLPRRDSSNELTKRLQKLALERQKENKDRLKVIQADHSSHLSSVKTFQELNLPKHLLDAIFAMGFDRPSAIQEAALPRILADPPRNLIGQAQSGSGKTAAFTLGMLYRIVVDDNPCTTQALCCTPTRELAIQIVDKAVQPMAAHMPGLKIELAISGNHIAKSVGVKAHLIVGTPGKVVDWLKPKIINPKTIKVFVLDEADNMVDEGGFRANSQLIKQHLPKRCQCLLFSATFTPEVVKFASKMVENPDKILIEDGPEFLVSRILSTIS
jgi:ATP-dependent RNA helicase DDX19/DBP5